MISNHQHSPNKTFIYPRDPQTAKPEGQKERRGQRMRKTAEVLTASSDESKIATALTLPLPDQNQKEKILSQKQFINEISPSWVDR